jgi:small-conductance mechanosensitive channel
MKMIRLSILVFIGTALLIAAGSQITVAAQDLTPTAIPNFEQTRTPLRDAPVATSVLVESDASSSSGSDGFDLSQLTTRDWISLILSVVLVALVLAFGRRIITNLLNRLAKRTKSTFDDELIRRIQGQIRWFVVVLGFDIGVYTLTFLSASTKSLLTNIFFLLYFVIIFSAAYVSMDFFFEWYEKQLEGAEEKRKMGLFLPLIHRSAIVVLIVIGTVILLDHFGVNVTGLAAILALVGLAVGLAAQDTISDMISGYIIIIDQPFRVGDRIEIPNEDTWGDVVEIGTRTTRIRTRDNTLVIIPNSSIANGQVKNYSYPDPNYRLQLDIGIAYGTDLEKVRKVLGDAVRNVEGVLPDKPVDILYNEMGDSSMSIRVRWWINSFADKRHMYDKVNTAMQHAIDEAGIESPFPTQQLNVSLDSESLSGDGGEDVSTQ